MIKYYFVVLAQFEDLEVLRSSECLYESKITCTDSMLSYMAMLCSLGYRIIGNNVKSINIKL